MSTSNPFLECYEAGAMLNQLNFSVQQAYLLPNKAAYEECDRLLATLVGRLGGAMGEVVAMARAEWRQYWKSEDHVEALWEANAEYECEDRLSAEIVCRRLLEGTITPWLGRVRDVARPKEPVLAQQIFDLGNLIDQGLRREDIYRFLREAPLVESTTDRSSLPTGDWSPGTERQPEYWLADCARRPGEISADISWWKAAIRRSWDSVGLEKSRLETALSAMPSSRDAEGIGKAVTLINREARSGIWMLWLNRPGRPSPEWDRARRILRIEDFERQMNANAKNVILILDAFQELNWPPAIYDPIRPREEMVSRDVLDDAITSLNRGMQESTIRFGMRYSGKGVGWEPKPPE